MPSTLSGKNESGKPKLFGRDAAQPAAQALPGEKGTELLFDSRSLRN
jgi:hypothetical protein